MATDLTVVLDDRAGQLAHMGEALGDAGVNIEGFSATTHDGIGVVHVLVDNAMVAQNALILADIKVEGEVDAVVIDLTDEADKPGTLGRVAAKVASAGINVSVAYLGMHDRAVLVTSDNEKALEALQA
ncbi:MAG TPA: ACT domain-containing protein [Actinomycetota bacterium]|nr:ACT domain-containing protein [Actinomycetota bacterium]